MTQLMELLARLETLDGAGLAAVVISTLLTLLIAPPPRKRRIRATVYLLLIYFALVGISRLIDSGTPARRFLDLAVRFFLLAAIGRAVFVLVTQALFRRALERWPKIFLDILHALIYVAAFIYILGEAGADPVSLLTGSAVLAVVIGLSLRDPLGNAFAGLFLQAHRPFEVGDWIQWDDTPAHIGHVVEINWRATHVVTLDAVEISIPHATLGQGLIVNFTRPRRWSRRSIFFHAPYDVPTRTVQDLVLEAVASSFGVEREPAPSVVTMDFDDSGVKYWLRFFTSEFDKRDRVDGEARDRIWYALHRAGIEMPSPLRKITIEEDSRQGQELKQQDQVRERMSALRCVDFFAPLESATLEHLARLSRTALYAPGERILRMGDTGDEMFIIKHGEVAVVLDQADQKPVEVARLGPGQFFGEMSLLAGEPRSASVKATRACELLAVCKGAFGRILEESPALAEKVSQIVAHRNAGLRAKQSEQLAVIEAPEEPEHLLIRIKNFFSI